MVINLRRFATHTAVAAVVCATSIALNPTSLDAQGPTPLADRIRGARAVVVAAVSSVDASWKENSFGDKLIVSRVHLHVEETLKGNSQPDVALDVEGGTVDGVSLHVSSLPMMEPGERAVFMLD